MKRQRCGCKGTRKVSIEDWTGIKLSSMKDVKERERTPGNQSWAMGEC